MRDNDRIQTLEKSVCVCVCGVGADIHHHGSGVYDFSHSIVLKAPSENRYKRKFKGKTHGPQVNLSQHTKILTVCGLLWLSIMAMSCAHSSEGEELSALKTEEEKDLALGQNSNCF